MHKRHPAHLECPLSLDGEEIRLLRLHCGGSTDIIECDFWKVDLADDPSYYALSYVWGSKSSRYAIHVNGWKFQITKNLYSALKRLRAHNNGKPILLWVDAVCIDQVWTPERNHQVGIMGRIYSKCREVVVWMGETQIVGAAEEEGDFTISEPYDKCHPFYGNEKDFGGNWEEYLSAFIFESGERKSLQTISGVVADLSELRMSLHCAWVLRQLAAGYHLPDLPPYCSTAFENSKYSADFENYMIHLQNHEWFSRLWVVQEAILAPSVRVFFGTVSLPLQILVRAMENFYAHTYDVVVSLPHVDTMIFAVSLECSFKTLTQSSDLKVTPTL